MIYHTKKGKGISQLEYGFCIFDPTHDCSWKTHTSLGCIESVLQQTTLKWIDAWTTSLPFSKRKCQIHFAEIKWLSMSWFILYETIASMNYFPKVPIYIKISTPSRHTPGPKTSSRHISVKTSKTLTQKTSIRPKIRRLGDYFLRRPQDNVFKTSKLQLRRRPKRCLEPALRTSPQDIHSLGLIDVFGVNVGRCRS